MTTPAEELIATITTRLLGSLTENYLAECRRSDEFCRKIADLEAAIVILNKKECPNCGSSIFS